MSTNYFSRHHENHRKILALLIEEMHPHAVVSADYVNALGRLFRADEEEQRSWKPGTIRTFGTCIECFGDGRTQNPHWFDDDECREPEVIDCETCRGVGLVEIVDPPSAVQPAPGTDDEMPF